MKHYYLLGAGGIGMSALGLVLRSLGHPVSGGDLSEGSNVALLRDKGAPIDTPENPDRLEEGMELIYSSDIIESHPVLVRARELGLLIRHRSELLRQFISPFKQLVVTGSHGKTTTTSLLLHLLVVAGWDPSYFVGSRLSGYLHGHLGKGSFAVIEGDESDGSFLKTEPFGAIITNIDNDHLSFWGSMERLKEAFGQFFTQVRECVWVCIDDPGIAAFDWPAHTYGFSPGAEVRIIDWKAAKGGMIATFSHDELNSELYIPLIGEHNLQNAAAIFGMGRSLGLSVETIGAAFKSFIPPSRRQEFLGEQEGILFYSDYAHHPTEIKATLEAFKSAFPKQRLCIVFQPHRYSRLIHCWDQFAAIFDAADLLFVTDIYAACEPPVEGLTGKALAETIGDRAIYLPEEKIHLQLDQSLQPGDLCIGLGAGSIDHIMRTYTHPSTPKRIELIS